MDDAGVITWQGILVGLGIALIPLILRTLWEEHRTKGERTRRDQALLTAVCEEVKAIRATAVNDGNLVGTELEAIRKDGKSLINPLDPIDGGFWDVIKFDPPSALAEDAEAMTHLREVARLTGMVNVMMDSRERFRMGNQALAGLQSMLARYDELLLRFLGEQIAAIDKLAPEIDAALSRLDPRKSRRRARR